MQTAQGNLVIIDAHTPDMKVLWKGKLVEGLSLLSVDNSLAGRRVVLQIAEDPVIAEMKAAGITVRRG